MNRHFVWLFALLMLVFGDAQGAAPPQREKVDLITYRGGSSVPSNIQWSDVNEPMADYYELLIVWYERPRLNKLVKLLPADVKFVADAALPVGKQVRYSFTLPGTGTFTYQIRICWNRPAPTPPLCTEWASSTDPVFARVDGQARGWQTYGYLESAGGVVVPPLAAPLPTSPSGPEK